MVNCCCDVNIEYNESIEHGEYHIVRYQYDNGFGIGWLKKLFSSSTDRFSPSKSVRADTLGDIILTEEKLVRENINVRKEYSDGSPVWAKVLNPSSSGAQVGFPRVIDITSSGNIILGLSQGADIILFYATDSDGTLLWDASRFDSVWRTTGICKLDDTTVIISGQVQPNTSRPMIQALDITTGLVLWETNWHFTNPNLQDIFGLSADSSHIYARWKLNSFTNANRIYVFDTLGVLIRTLTEVEIPEILSLPESKYNTSTIKVTNTGNFGMVFTNTLNTYTPTGSLVWSKTFSDDIEDFVFSSSGECTVSLGVGGVAKLNSGGSIIHEYAEVSLVEPNVTHSVYSADDGLNNEWAVYTGSLESF